MHDRNKHPEGEVNPQSGGNPQSMTCMEMESFIVDYLDQKLPQRERLAFVAHLDECPDCTNFLHHYDRSIKTSKEAYQNIEPQDCSAMPENLVQAILLAKTRGS